MAALAHDEPSVSAQPRRRWSGRAGPPLLAAALLAGLAAAPLPPATPADELRLGAAEHPKVLDRYGGVYADARVADYVQRVGERVVAEVANPYAFRFTVLDSPRVTALSAPGGYVYVTRGLLALANSEAELAAVLAHEAAHVLERHGVRRLAEEAAFWAEHRAEGVDALREHMDSRIRMQELEADRIGIRLAARAGYHPMGQAWLLQSMARHLAFRTRIAQEHGHPPPEVEPSHPAFPERLAAAAAVAEAVAAEARRDPRTAAWAVGRAAYLDAIDGIAWGGTPEKGMAVGPIYTRTETAVALAFPPGYELGTDATTLLGVGPHGARVSLRHIYTRGRQIRLLPFLIGNYGFSQHFHEVREFEVAGLAAVAGHGRRPTDAGDVEVHVTLVRRFPDLMLRLDVTIPSAAPAEARRSARDAVLGLRVLNAAERAAAAPLRVEVREAPAAATVPALAARMGFVDRAEEQLRLLNGIGPDDGLPADRRVKLIVR